jgi:RNA polymerase sigma-70 factor (ECF subfamily)
MRHLRTVARQDRGAPVGDAELLERFIVHRDEEAFELLVRRHGPMVLGVCKRVLANETDAEDAFQATFLVLVRKAASIVPRTQVGNWLHGVAHKTALKARAMNRRRRVKEREGAARCRGAPDDTWQLLLELLDAELGALPEKYRAPIVLCDLEGLSYREAAARLRCPQGTLSGRLTRARALLARRLARRGPAVGAATLAALLARDASASVRPPLLASTVRAGVVLAAGHALTDGPVSCKVASLTEGVLKMLLLSRLRVVAGGFVLLVAVVAVGWMCAARVPARAAMPEDDAVPRAGDEPRTPARKAHAADGPAESPEAEFVVRGADGDGKTVSLVVAGTSAPVLRLPVKDGVRVLVRGRQVGMDGLRPGTRVAIRLDPTNRVIEDIRTLPEPAKVTVLKGASDRADLEPPSEAEVLRALPRVANVPAFLEVYRDDIQVVTERLVRQVDPPRFFPLVGEAELHHCHWKCTVYYGETVDSIYPYPFRTRRPRVELVYIDKDYLVPTR